MDVNSALAVGVGVILREEQLWGVVGDEKYHD